jgi:hypothetical protein
VILLAADTLRRSSLTVQHRRGTRFRRECIVFASPRVFTFLATPGAHTRVLLVAPLVLTRAVRS